MILQKTALVSLMFVAMQAVTSHAKTVVIDYVDPLIFPPGSHTVDLKNELLFSGELDYSDLEEYEVEKVTLLAKSQTGRAIAQLVGDLDSYRQQIENPYNQFESDAHYTFDTVYLTNGLETPPGQTRQDWLLALETPYRSRISSQIKVAKITVELKEKPQLTWSLVESFRPKVGESDQTKSRLSWYGDVQSIRIYVDKRDVTITDVEVEFADGRRGDRNIRALEGRYRQKSGRTFELRQLGGRQIREITVRGYTHEDQGGRARVNIYVQSYR